MVQAILGCWILGMLVLWIAAEVAHVSRKIKSFLHAILAGANQPAYVEQTINQMYGDVRVEQREGSNYRKASHGIREAKGGR